jgi:hypothetical protein
MPHKSLKIEENIKTDLYGFEHSDNYTVFPTVDGYKLAVYDESKSKMIAQFECSNTITSMGTLHRMKADDPKNNYNVIPAMTEYGSLEMCLVSD